VIHIHGEPTGAAFGFEDSANHRTIGEDTQVLSMRRI
jgi:hypothetical protein